MKGEDEDGEAPKTTVIIFRGGGFVGGVRNEMKEIDLCFSQSIRRRRMKNKNVFYQVVQHVMYMTDEEFADL